MKKYIEIIKNMKIWVAELIMELSSVSNLHNKEKFNRDATFFLEKREKLEQEVLMLKKRIATDTKIKLLLLILSILTTVISSNLKQSIFDYISSVTIVITVIKTKRINTDIRRIKFETEEKCNNMIDDFQCLEEIKKTILEIEKERENNHDNLDEQDSYTSFQVNSSISTIRQQQINELYSIKESFNEKGYQKFKK